jgi:putative hydrolase of HD superfamily
LADLERKRGVRVDVERVLRIAVLHDLSESLTFDISKAYLQYLGKRGHEIKHQLEHSAWSQLVRGLRSPRLAREYTRLQSEYEVGASFESKIVHAADGLDVLLQVLEYRERGYADSLLAELWKGTSNELKRCDVPSAKKVLRAILVEARRRRKTTIR